MENARQPVLSRDKRSLLSMLGILSYTTKVTDAPAVQGLDGLSPCAKEWTRIDNDTPFVRPQEITPFNAGSCLRALVGDSPGPLIMVQVIACEEGMMSCLGHCG